MTAAQEQRAIQLLRFSLDWVGMIDLAPEEEAASAEVGLLIDDLLVEIGARECRETSEERRQRLMRAVIQARQWVEAARQQHGLYRTLTIGAVNNAGPTTSLKPTLVRACNLAWDEVDRAEAALGRAENDLWDDLEREGR